MANFKDRRQELAQDLFSSSPKSGVTTSGTPRTDGLKSKFQRLEKLKKQQLSRWWDGTTLAKYMKNEKIPKGLRILIFPTFEDLDQDSLKNWEGNLRDASFNMMRILIRNAERKGLKLHKR